MLTTALKDRLSVPTEQIRFPDRTSVIGTLINSYLSSASNMNDQTIHLLFSANRWEAADGLETKLREGTTLVRMCIAWMSFHCA
jgi:dTMP kinase